MKMARGGVPGLEFWSFYKILRKEEVICFSLQHKKGKTVTVPGQTTSEPLHSTATANSE